MESRWLMPLKLVRSWREERRKTRRMVRRMVRRKKRRMEMKIPNHQ